MNKTHAILTLMTSSALLICSATSWADPSGEVVPQPLPLSPYSPQQKSVIGPNTCQPKDELIPSQYTALTETMDTDVGYLRRVSTSQLPVISGFEAQGLEVGCDSEEGVGAASYIYEFSRGSQRIELLNHVIKLEVAPSGDIFFLENFVKRRGWEHQFSIMNLRHPTKKQRLISLASTRCSVFGGWSPKSDRFWMTDDYSNDEICIFNTDGELLQHWRVPLFTLEDEQGRPEILSDVRFKGEFLIHTGSDLQDDLCRADVINLSTREYASRQFKKIDRVKICNFSPLFTSLSKAKVTIKGVREAMKGLGRKISDKNCYVALEFSYFGGRGRRYEAQVKSCPKKKKLRVKHTYPIAEVREIGRAHYNQVHQFIRRTLSDDVLKRYQSTCDQQDIVKIKYTLQGEALELCPRSRSVILYELKQLLSSLMYSDAYR